MEATAQQERLVGGNQQLYYKMILANLLLAKFVLDTTIWRNLVQQNVICQIH